MSENVNVLKTRLLDKKMPSCREAQSLFTESVNSESESGLLSGSRVWKKE